MTPNRTDTGGLSEADRESVVSVVTPSFNQGEFLAAALESVLDQAGDFHLDYRVLDGGSSDDSVEILRRFEAELASGARRPNCRGISFTWSSALDGGQAAAVNAGFALARGEVLGWLNSDDTYLPGALATALEYLAANPETVMVYGNAYHTGRDGSLAGSYHSEPFSLERLAEKCIVCQPAAFLRRAALEQVGGLDESLRAGMDFDLWIRMGRRFAGRIAFIPEYLATSRCYPETKTNAQRGTVHRENLALLERHFGYVPGEWLVACFYDLREQGGRPLTRTLAELWSRRFALHYLLNTRTLASLAGYLRHNLHKLLPASAGARGGKDDTW